MDIQDHIAKLAAAPRDDSPEYTATLRYWSHGPQTSGFPKAMIVRVNDGPEHVFDVPDKLGTHELVVDITADMKPTGVNVIHWQVDVYNYEPFGIRSSARVLIRRKRAVILDENYETPQFWRRTNEQLTVF